MSNLVTKQERTPEMIATEIRIIKERAAQTLAQAAFEIGRRLCEAKELVPAGNWLDYLENELDYKSSTAENLMRIYREFGDEQVDLLTGRSPAEVFGKLNQSQMVAMFSLTPPERAELMDEHPELPEMSAREVQKLVAEKKAAEEERDRERRQRETAEKLATEQADRAEKVDAQLKKKTEEAKKQNQRIDELKKQLAAVKGSEEKAQLAADLEKELDQEREARNRLEEELKELKEKPVEATYTEPPEELKAQIRSEVEREYQIKIDAANQKIENLQNQDAQAINVAFKLIQSQFGEMRNHFEAFRAASPEKARLLAAASAQTFRNMAEVVERFQ